MVRAYQARQRGANGRVPLAHSGLQINFCRNLECANFGVPPAPFAKRGKKPADQQDSSYHIVGGAKETNTMVCVLCGQSFQLKSNTAVIEEFERQRRHFLDGDSVSCRDPACVNHQVQDPSRYQSFGKSAVGSSRYRCKSCLKTFSVSSKSTARQRKPEINEMVLRLLVNKMPMRRICEAADIHPQVLYNRLAFIKRQATRFAVAREAQLSRMDFDRLRICVDRQDHVFNWVSSADRRNTQLSATGSAECASGYVLGLELDHEPDLQPFEVDLHAREIGDYALAHPFRKYARLMLPGDISGNLDDPDGLFPGERLPALGLRIRPEYVLIGHFQYLRWLLPATGTLHFYLDQEPAIRGACLAAFFDLVSQGRMEAYFVRIAKDLSVEKKKLVVAHSENYLARLREVYPGLSRWRIAKEVMAQRYVVARGQHASAANRWVESILPHMGEPLKHVCYLTDRGDADPAAVAEGMLNASLHPIDRFFMQMRRRISLLERPIASANAQRRVWHGYSPYNPAIAQSVMTSFRVVYNYCLAGKDGKTPAMRLGLAAQPVSYDEMLNFVSPR